MKPRIHCLLVLACCAALNPVSWTAQAKDAPAHPDPNTPNAASEGSPDLTPQTAKPPSAESRHVVFGLSPYLDRSTKDPLFREMIRFLLEGAPSGTTVSFFDAYGLRTISQVAIPRIEAFASPKTRATQFRKPIQELRQFLARENTPPQVTGLSFSNALQAPQFLESLSQTGPQSTPPSVVVLVGSPLHMDAKETRFSMMQGTFPSDGHLLASSEGSIYGIAGRDDALQGTTVHWAYPADPWTNELHRDRITRFWTLFIQRQGGRRGAFTGDLPSAFATLRSSMAAHGQPAAGKAPPAPVPAVLSSSPNHAPAESLATVSPPLDPKQTKVEMLRVTRDVATTDWITSDQTPRPAQSAPANPVGPLKIGIRWKGQLDLDLYATPAPGAKRLYFENPKSREGYYFKDHRSSPDREYEFIEFLEPVDVRHVSAMVNFYEGRADGGAEGEIRVEFEGRIYSDRFSLAASQGNQGREGASQSDFWCPIDLLQILRLR